MPNSSRHAAATALIGFQLAIVCSNVGSPCVGTKAFDMNVIGRNTMNAVACAASTFFITMPRHAPAQLMAKAKRSSSTTATMALGTPLSMRHPTT